MAVEPAGQEVLVGGGRWEVGGLGDLPSCGQTPWGCRTRSESTETEPSACEEEDGLQHRHPRPGCDPPRDAGSNVQSTHLGRWRRCPQVQGRGRLGRRPGCKGNSAERKVEVRGPRREGSTSEVDRASGRWGHPFLSVTPGGQEKGVWKALLSGIPSWPL